ncbi:MAG: hypothetical protein E6I76_20535 [Chloroflexi bacterium]|nr:MAG: hypothetical protein E6I76_20535 [Chloroflexota bacterium]
MRRWGHALALAGMVGGVLAACGEDGTASTPPSPQASAAAIKLKIEPTISELLTGTDRMGLALFDTAGKPVTGAQVTMEVQGTGGVDEHRPLRDIGPEYGGIPVYTGTASFPTVGVYKLLVSATLPGGGSGAGSIGVKVTDTGSGLPIGAKAPAVKQPIVGDPGVTVGMVDSGNPPDAWHDATVADGLARHRPMVLYFGEPGFCKSRTCGPTVQILQQFAKTYGDRLLIEHIEDHFPAGPDEGAKDDPGFTAFGLGTDPWIYFVNADGVIADRFEGPVTVSDLSTAADGTLAGHVPAVTISLNG